MSKGRFRKPDKLQNQSNEGKGKAKRKSEDKERKRRKKRMVALSVLTIATLKIFDRKKPFDAKGLFGDDVIKNPARHISLSNYPYLFETFSLLR